MKIAIVNKSIVFLLLLAIGCPGCFLFPKFQNEQFETGNGSQPIALKVPKGYQKKEVITDSTGHKTLAFTYGNDQVLFFSTNARLSPYIDTAQHFTRPHLQGGIFYKGILPRLLFWREVYSQNLRYGYRNVSPASEPLFDSSLNFLKVR